MATETTRRIFGRYWEEFRSLAQESDPDLFYEGLFATAARLESENYSDAAARIYRALSEGAASLPGPLQARARRRWEAMAGIGTSGARVELLLRRFAVECADPSTLLGMGLAGAAFRMTRLAALSRLAATPGLGSLARGFGARLTAGLAGYAVEGLVFPAATHFGRWTLGHSQDWNARQLGRELALSYLSLGFLRLGGGLAARGSAAFAVQGSFTSRLLPVAGMWLGLVMSHQAETALGLRSRQDGATTFLDSLAMLLQFHVAGRLAHHAFGESFAVWEQGMELQSRALSRAEPSFPDFGNFGAGSNARPLLVSGAGPVSELPVARMSSKEEGNGGRPSPVAGPREEALPSAPRPGNAREGLEVESFAQILRHIATPAFRTQFQAENAVFRFKEAFPADLQSRVESLQSYLNIFSNSARWRIPVGRRLMIHSVGGNQTLYFIKSSNAGFEIRLPSPVTREEGARPSNPDLAGVNSDMRAVAAKPRLSGTFTEIPRVVRAAAELREVIPAVLRTVKPGKSFQASFVLERSELDLKALSEVTQGLQARATGTFRVLVPQMRRTYVGLAGPHGISWNQSLSAGWGSALGRAIFSEAVLKNAEEAYQQVEAYSRDRNRQPDTESRWTIREKVGDPEGFSRFLLETLNSYRINGRKVSVHLTVEGKRLEFVGSNGTWRSDTAREPSRAEPISRPVQAEPPKGSPEAVQEIEAEDPVQRGIVLKSISIPLLHHSDMEHISAVLQRAYDDRAEREGPRVVIAEAPSLKAPEGQRPPQLSSTLLAKLTQGLKSFEAGTEFLVLNVSSRQTFVGRVVSDTLHWSVGNSSEWRVAAMRTLRHQPVKVGNAVELYLYLQALPNHMRRYAREESELNSREISVVWDGPMPRTFQYDLKTFVSYSLITHNPFGKNLTIEFPSGALPIRMENYQGDLWMERREEGESGPDAGGS